MTTHNQVLSGAVTLTAGKAAEPTETQIRCEALAGAVTVCSRSMAPVSDEAGHCLALAARFEAWIVSGHDPGTPATPERSPMGESSGG